MTATKYAYSLKSRQETFSVAYIRAIAAAAGYSVTKDNIDQDSVDIYISQRGNKENEEDYPYYSILKVQVKCTYRHKPKSDGFIHFPLKLKNYNDLRRKNTADPFILVILYVPGPNEMDWLVEQADSMILHNTAHWISLRGADPSENDTEQTVLVPEAQRFDVYGLRSIMNMIAQGEIP